LPKNYEYQVQKLKTYTQELDEHEKELQSLNDSTKIGLLWYFVQLIQVSIIFFKLKKKIN
jgi:hypothetical protein